MIKRQSIGNYHVTLKQINGTHIVYVVNPDRSVSGMRIKSRLKAEVKYEEIIQIAVEKAEGAGKGPRIQVEKRFQSNGLLLQPCRFTHRGNCKPIPYNNGLYK